MYLTIVLHLTHMLSDLMMYVFSFIRLYKCRNIQVIFFLYGFSIIKQIIPLVNAKAVIARRESFHFVLKRLEYGLKLLHLIVFTNRE